MEVTRDVVDHRSRVRMGRRSQVVTLFEGDGPTLVHDRVGTSVVSFTSNRRVATAQRLEAGLIE